MLEMAVRASRHLLWYLDWETGGRPLREAVRPQRPGPARHAA
jgi:hypothetical protein